MKAFIAVVALAATLTGTGGALAFDVLSRSTDYEAREQSERLHVQQEKFPDRVQRSSAGDALASAPQRSTRAIQGKQKKGKKQQMRRSTSGHGDN